jgi:hypothetical protein
VSKTRTILAALLALTGMRCAGTETGNPSSQGELAYDAYSSDVARVALRSSGGSYEPGRAVVDAAWLVMGDFTLTRGCAAPASVLDAHATGIGEGDHAAGGRVVTALTLEAGEYCGAHVPLLRAAAANAAGPELRDHSIMIDGVAPNGRTFRLRSRMAGAIDLHGQAPFAIGPGHDQVLIGFDLAVWLAAVPWDEAVVAAGVIEIDGANNPALLAAFEAAVARGTGLYRGTATAPIEAANELARGE